MTPIDKLLPGKRSNLLNGLLATVVVGMLIGRKIQWSDDQDKALSDYYKKYDQQKIRHSKWAKKENT
jgi:hypothetical protein